MPMLDWRFLKVRDLMTTRVKTLTWDTSIGRAHTEMRESHFRHFPVLGEDGDLAGLLSDRDLFRAVGQGPVGKSRAVRDVMTTRMRTIREDAPAFTAARLMRELKIGMLPVLGAEGKLVGIITETDFLQVAETALRRERVKARKRSGSP